MTDIEPPSLAVAIIRRLAGPDESPYVLSDLAEEFNLVVERSGLRAARRWYWEQTLRSTAPLAASKFASLAPRRLGGHIRHTVRLLRRSPGLTATVMTTVALAIGANTATFSVVDALIFRPLPYQTPDRLVSIWESTPRAARVTVAPADWLDYSRDCHSFDALASFVVTSMLLSNVDTPEQLTGEVVSANLLPVLGTHPAIGRSFTSEDEHAGPHGVVILSDRIWRRRFQADPGVLGRTIALDNKSYEIVGVLPPGFEPVSERWTGAPVSFLVAAAYSPEVLASREHELRVIGRLRPGVTLVAAQNELDRATAAINRDSPGNPQVRATVAGLQADMVRNFRASLLVMLGAVGLIILVACANVANLLVVWGMDRRRDVAIRLALGASRSDVVVEYLVFGIGLVGLGGMAGVALGALFRNTLVHLAPPAISRVGDLQLDGRVLAVTIAVCLMTGIAAGLVPALPVLRRRLSPSLRMGSLAAGTDRSIVRWRGVLLVAELAIAVMLALGAGLLTRSLIALNGVDLGFETAHVLALSIQPSIARAGDPATRLSFFEEVTSRIAALPGVESVAFADQFPMRGGWSGRLFVVDPSGPVQAEADLQAVSPTYFSTLGIPLVRGRLLTSTDRTGTTPVAVVSETFVRQFLANRNPIDAQIQRSPSDPLVTIVGVVGEIRRDGKFSQPVPEVYLSAGQTALYRVPLRAIAVRSGLGTGALAPSIRKVVASIDPQLPITNIGSLDDIVSSAVAPRRFNSWLLATFAVVAVALALIGVYGVISHLARQRAPEIGIRIALGATRRQVTSLVIRAGLTWMTAGIAIGVTGALLLSRVLSSLLFEITPTDPVTFAGVTALVLLVAVAASYVPARRAACGDPLTALRRD